VYWCRFEPPVELIDASIGQLIRGPGAAQTGPWAWIRVRNSASVSGP